MGEVILAVMPLVDKVVVVDYGSSDGTFEEASKFNVVVLKHETNLGKGCAMITGCDHAVSLGASNIILIDSDGQHDPGMIPLMIKEIENQDIVFVSRKFNKEMPLVFRIGNWGLSLTCAILYNVGIHDALSGYKIMTKYTYNEIKWTSNGYGVESEILASVGKRKLKHKEIYTKTIYRDKKKGTGIWDGIKIFADIIKWKVIK